MKKAVYTVLLNDYDYLNEIKKEVGYDYICFTDDPELRSSSWEIRLVKPIGDVVKFQRTIKILAHKYLPEYDLTVYIDANMRLKTSISNLMRYYTGGILIPAHPERTCVYKEAVRVIQLNKANKEDVDVQMRRYKSIGFPSNYGMWADGFMIRDKSPLVTKMCDIWQEELMNYTHRDQLSVGYAVRESGIKVTNINFNVLLRNISIMKHKIKEKIKVFYSTPFSSDKNIGKANNNFIRLLPNDSWVCITDGDAMFLEPDFGAHIENIIQRNQQYGLIGCVTNRLRGLHQLYNNEFSEDMNVRNHLKISNELRKENNTIVEEISGVAGVCMIFSKETWLKAKGFQEKSYTTDSDFNKRVRRIGKKIGLAKGLYMFHGYRIWEDNYESACSNINHLK